MKLIITIVMCVLTLQASAQKYPYQNSNLSALERAKDLCSRLTLEEKAKLMLDEHKGRASSQRRYPLHP